MSYTPNTWQERQGSGLNRFQDQNGNLYEFTAVPTEVTQAGTPFSATWMNHIEQGIADAVPSEEKGTANGIATLDASGKLTQMPTASDVGAVASADLEKRLWSSSSGWTSGSITVPGFSNYHLFAIQVGSAIRCLGVRYNTGSLQFSGIVTSANYAVSYSGSFLIDGDSLTWNGCRSLSHYPDSYSGGNGHSNVVDQSITAIYGIL
jgi:hypothetical protein